VAEVVVRAFADLSIRTKLIVIVAGTLLLAQSLSALLIREVVSKHILHQALDRRHPGDLDPARRHL